MQINTKVVKNILPKTDTTEPLNKATERIFSLNIMF